MLKPSPKFLMLIISVIAVGVLFVYLKDENLKALKTTPVAEVDVYDMPEKTPETVSEQIDLVVQKGTSTKEGDSTDVDKIVGESSLEMDDTILELNENDLF